MTVRELVENFYDVKLGRFNFDPDTDVTLLNIGTGEYVDVGTIERDLPRDERDEVIVIRSA